MFAASRGAQLGYEVAGGGSGAGAGALKPMREIASSPSGARANAVAGAGGRGA